MKRKILVILSNRLSPSQKVLYFELDCKNDGSILDERPLKKKPSKPDYDEVWENDEGKNLLKYCNRIKRLYRHPLQKRAVQGSLASK